MERYVIKEISYQKSRRRTYIYIAKDRTSWKVKCTSNTTAGKYGTQNVLKEKNWVQRQRGKNVGDNVSSAMRLFMDGSILRHIINVWKKRQVLNNQENCKIPL